MPSRNRFTTGKFMLVLLAVALISSLLAGCGGPKPDVDIFIMPKNMLPEQVTKDVKAGLEKALGADKTIAVTGAGFYNQQKLVVELAAGEHDIFIVPSDDFKMLVNEGGAVPLEDTFDKTKYKEGVMEGTVIGAGDTEKKETHLYGIPITASKMLKAAGFTSATEEPDHFILVFSRAKDPALAKQAVKEMIGS